MIYFAYFSAGLAGLAIWALAVELVADLLIRPERKIGR